MRALVAGDDGAERVLPRRAALDFVDRGDAGQLQAPALGHAVEFGIGQQLSRR